MAGPGSTNPAAAVATGGGANAEAATPFAPRADPALNPNQPNHRIAAPVMTIGTLCGTKASLPYPRRRPRYTMAARAAAPALMWTTVPPAKSSAPKVPSHPPPHTQWARGEYTTRDHSARN